MSIRVLLAMSGGVDSSVAAHVLRQGGYDVIGLFMRTGVHEDSQGGSGSGGSAVESCSIPVGIESVQGVGGGGLPIIQPSRERASNRRGCCSASDAADARRVADRLDIPFYAIDFEEEFDQIIDYFVDEYTMGRTPNPCVMCNNWLKFGRLWEFAQQIDATHIATGHYARVQNGSLLQAADPAKDQSYVLYGIRREILPFLLFPIGDYSKADVRQLARSLELPVAEKPDSQEICFVPSDDYLQVIRSRRPDFDGAGDIVDSAGAVIGRHSGFEGYTIGQRKGLGVALGERRYVLRIEPGERRVVIGPRTELLSNALEADRVNWLCEPPADPFDCDVKIRYLHQPARARVSPMPRSMVRVQFTEPQPAITPGQAVVFYDGPRVLGGGTIQYPLNIEP